MPAWPFVATTILGVIVFGLLGERNSASANWSRVLVVVLTSLASFVAWLLLLNHEAWSYSVDVQGWGLKGHVLGYVVGFLLAVGPLVTSFLFLVIAGAGAVLMPALIRSLHERPSDEGPSR